MDFSLHTITGILEKLSDINPHIRGKVSNMLVNAEGTNMVELSLTACKSGTVRKVAFDGTNGKILRSTFSIYPEPSNIVDLLLDLYPTRNI